MGKRLRVVAVATLLLALVPGQSVRAATIWIWPSSAPCNGTLQACIDNASSGDEVLIAQNGFINEQITISDKSLTLQPEAGFAPEVNVLIIRTPTGGSAIDVLVAHVQVAHTIFVSLDHGSGHTVTLDHVTAQSSGADPGIYGTIYVQSAVNVLDSSITQAGFYPGILLTSPVSHANLTWNVRGNTISGALASMTQAGIYLSVTDANSVRGDVDNNSIWDVGQGVNSGDHGGILLYARDSGDANFNVIGNTMAKIHGSGVTGNNQQQSPNRFELDLFDNIIASTSDAAVTLENVAATGPFAVRGGRNDFYANGKPNRLAGTDIGQHLKVPPRFINAGAGNLQLKASSPMIDRGVTCSPGGVAGPDAAGLNRLFGPAVDIGAFEWNAGPPGMVEVGTKGPDTMTGGPRTDILCGGGGNDMLFGNRAPDFLAGGTGRDRLYGGPGKDRLFGERGNDLLCARDGKPGDYLNGGKGTDSYRADAEDAKISMERLGNCAA